MIRLKCIPTGQVGGGLVLWEALAVGRQDRVIQFEAEKGEIAALQESRDLDQSHGLLLNMEEQVAAGAEAEEILRVQNGGKRGGIAALHQRLAETADLVRTTIALALQRACRHDRTPGPLAIKAQQH